MERWDDKVHEDHEALASQAGAMEAALTIEMGPEDRRVVFSWIIRMLWPALELHLRKEEEVLFRALQRLLGENASAILVLKEQHRQLRGAHRHLAELIQPGGHMNWDVISIASEAFIELLEDHDRKIERLLLDVLRFSMNGRELKKLAQDFQMVAQKAHEEEGWPKTQWGVRPLAPKQPREELHRHSASKKLHMAGVAVLGIFLLTASSTFGAASPKEEAILTYTPEVPPPIARKDPRIVVVHLDSTVQVMEIGPNAKYEFWTFNGRVPGPLIRARVGDTLEVHVTSHDPSGMPHNVDFHAVTGPGGGATVTTAVEGEEKVAYFKLLHPGLFVYHCAAPPVMDHIANGMYGLILVEPKGGLPKVDREFYVLQSEFYTKEPAEGEELLKFSHEEGTKEHPRYVVFNGKAGSLTGDGALKAKTGEQVRIYFGNAGPNLISSFHLIGEIFDNVYREGDLVSPPGHSIQTTLVPSGGATVVEFGLEVPGNYTLVDHAIFRVEKGAVGYLQVGGKSRHDIYVSKDDPEPCEGCLVHP
ncbi:MAG: nitrite reductase, copper-containing [Elusimicrobia bacterium]|nr:nitrite reductase, copper-containing [Elusimicrobiota bacterium]